MEYRIIEGLDNMELSDIVRLLRTTYWAGDRPVEVIETALKNSRCFGIRLPGSNTLAAFARVVSDGATMYYLADVVVDEAYSDFSNGPGVPYRILPDLRPPAGPPLHPGCPRPLPQIRLRRPQR